MTEVAIRAVDLTKSYRRGREEVPVLRGLDLEIARGEFVSLMGPSGSGKTTLLNLLGGLDEPTGGYVEVAGARFSDLSAGERARWRARHIGFVFQLYNLIPVLNARRNVELPLLLTGLSRKRRREQVEVALSLVGLEHRAKHTPSQLSGGEEQRVSIARALVSDPTILLCDEPTGDLDRATGDGILDLLTALNRDHGKTILLVTHDPRAALRAGRALRVQDGALVDGAGAEAS